MYVFLPSFPVSEQKLDFANGSPYVIQKRNLCELSSVSNFIVPGQHSISTTLHTPLTTCEYRAHPIQAFQCQIDRPLQVRIVVSPSQLKMESNTIPESSALSDENSYTNWCDKEKSIEKREILPFTIDTEPKNAINESIEESQPKEEQKRPRTKVGNDKERLSKCLTSDYQARKYSCTVCDKKFKDKRGIDEHMRYHNEEKPFECPECGKKYYQHTHLKEHIRVHTGEKPYECFICNKKFRHATNFSRHKRKVHCISNQSKKTKQVF